MWLFTVFGFFSIVRKSDDPHLTIRSRTLGDLRRLRNHYLPQATAPSAQGGSDYPWRMHCGADELAQALPRIVADIDYGNFKDEVALMTGKARASRYGDVWQVMHGMRDDLPEPGPQGWADLPWPEKDPVGKPRAFGGVVIDPSGRILLREVAGHYGGYVWSFAKGRPDPGESPRETALREVREEMGVDARILLPMPGTFRGTTTRTHFFLMNVDPREVDLDMRSRETARLCWVLPDEARSLIALTTDAAGRERDLAVLQAALDGLPAPPPLKRPIARREDWSNRLMPARRERLASERILTPAEMARVSRGFIPVVQEQKWFAFFEDGTLHLHRSWTGLAVYRLRFEPLPKKPGHWRIALAEVNRHPRQYQHLDDDEDVAMVASLIDDLLIGHPEEPAVDGLAEAARLAAQPRYLGNPVVVESLVDPYLLSVRLRLRDMLPEASVMAAAQRIVRAMTDDPDWVRMPWHCQAQLGASLVGLMNLDPVACARKGLASTVAAALAAVRDAVTEIWEATGRGADNGPDSDGAIAFGRLSAFVVSALLGTTSLVFPGMRLEDFGPRPQP